MRAKRPTLADVAERAGTSTAVVSYVLNNGPRPVSDALRARVVEALDELNYRPDRIAQALRRPRRWRQVGLLVPDLSMPLFRTLVARVEFEARERRHLTMIGSTGFDPEREVEFARSFTDVGIDGLLVVGAVDAPATAELCARARIPVVWVHNSRGRIEAPVIGADHVAAGRLATRHLVDEHGCDDVVFVGGFTAEEVRHGDRETVAQRLQGFRSVVGESAEVVGTDLSAAGAYAAVGDFLRRRGRVPQGMVVGTYGQSAAAVRAVTDAGLGVPGDIRIVGFDADTANDYRQISLTAVQQRIDAIAGRALGCLLDESGSGGADPAPDWSDVLLNLRESCGCAAGGGPVRP
ncbi:LacI family transcriptional regulator [Rhodococcus triatomae]|uniref:LacI family transcriptional regulator n=1 Tax=Rhodococcus triatomae TaxID=300028 RepID=A0A1G8MAE9_9NOCA|nr:LacI family DNA-binding transcriptional regulator [Rhodococcus triatomae]SDI64956.1 LacI family transcriptional regulator [Rhodococcus triatomae]